jgi:DNA-binding response OmpR family regulator
MKALVVDDDLVLADVISFTLRRAGFNVLLAYDGRTALTRFSSDTPDIVILDVELPGKNGLDVCREMRAKSDTPIIMLTVRDTDEDVIKGLSIGADDYVTKPFSPAQLVARVQAVLRRAGRDSVPRQLFYGGHKLNPDRHTLEQGDDEPIQLTQLEFKLLETFLVNSGQVLPANTLIDRVWGPGGGDKAMLKQLVYRLRRKIETDQSDVFIEAIPGIGYALTQRQQKHN